MGGDMKFIYPSLKAHNSRSQLIPTASSASCRLTELRVFECELFLCFVESCSFVQALQLESTGINWTRIDFYQINSPLSLVPEITPKVRLIVCLLAFIESGGSNLGRL